LATSIHQLISRTHKEFGFTGIVVSHTIPQVFDISDYVAMLADGVIRKRCAAASVLRLREPGGTAIYSRQNRRPDPSSLGVTALNHSRTDVVVGLFVLVGLTCLGYLAIRLGKLELFASQGYVVYATLLLLPG
jgi:energy-coupling factor transporter ATP-binding protein EcfA2